MGSNKIVGGEWIAQMLAAEGVTRVFGIVDGTYLGLFASFAKHGIELVSPRHETTAAHMAGAYARLTGTLGVCIASNGPGVANLLPGIAVENGEGNRVLCITSCRRPGIAYPDRGGTYQYFDQVAVTRPMTKWSCAVPSFERLAETLRRAFRAAYHGRPGVVHVDVPENVINGTFDVSDTGVQSPREYRRTAPLAARDEDVRAVAEILVRAERPLIHAGSGVVHARAFAALADVAEACVAPVSTSWGARGVLPETHRLSLPTRTLAAIDEARQSADAVLVVGSRLGETDFWGKAPYWGRASTQRLAQVDCDEDMLGVNRRCDVAAVADAGEFLRALAAELKRRGVGAELRKAREDRVARLVALKQSALDELNVALNEDTTPVHPARVPHAVSRAMQPDDVLVVDGGNTAVWTQFFHEMRTPGGLLSTFKLGMLGAGPGQALGAQVARPDARVVCVLGDGAMGFHMQEVETAVRNKLPVTFVVLCDRQWGMVKLTQMFGLGAIRETLGTDEQGTINADLGEIKFDELARSMGATGLRVGSATEFEAALTSALAARQPTVIHVDVDPMAHLWPPGLQTFKDMHQEPTG